MPPIGGFAGGLAGTGEGLGNAHGTITLDVSDLLRAQQISRTVGQNIENNLGGIGKTSEVAKKALGVLVNEIAAIKRAADTAKLGSLGQDVASGSKSVTQAAVEYRNFKDELRAVGEQARRTADETRTLTDRLGGGLASASKTISAFRTEIAAIGLGAGLLTNFGLEAANQIRVARIRLRQFVQTEEEADALMSQLADGAGEFGLELGAVLSFASTLLPVIEGNVEATAEWVERAARLRTVFPGAQRGAELRALSEYISGNVVSLQRLFNIAPSLIQEAKAQFTDVGEQLDYILDRMGATTEAAREIADPMVAVRNELKLIAAVGFDPILQKLRELLPEVRQWLETIRETHPEILEIGASFVTAVAIGAPLLLFVNQVLATLIKIKQLGLLGTLGKVGLVGLGVAAIPAASGGIIRAFGRATNNETFANMSDAEGIRNALKSVADLFFSFVSLMAPVNQLIIDALLNFGQAVIDVYSLLGTLLSRIGELLPAELGGDRFAESGGALTRVAERLSQTITEIQQENEHDVQNFRERIERDRAAFAAFLDRLFNIGQDGGSAGAGVFGGAMAGAGTGGITEEQQAQIDAWEQYQEQIAALESRAQEQRLRLTEQYEQQRTRIIEQYEKQIAREAEDFARQRARANQQLQRDIEAIQGGAVEREAEWWQDLTDVIARMREESGRRIAEIEADAARQREQMERQHRVNLLEAASRLDAQAVASEQRRFHNQITNFDQDLAARLAAERRNLDERIQQEREAHQERLAEARQSDAERIEDLREAHAERIAIEDEDRAVRLQRMKEDHQEQLLQLKEQHRQRLTELKEQARRELLELRNEFIKRSIELTNFYTQWQTTQVSEQMESLRAWQQFWKDWLRTQQAATSGSGAVAGAAAGAGAGAGGGTTPPPEERPTRRELEQLAISLAVQAGWTQEAIFELMRMMRDMTDAVLAQWIERAFNYDVPGYARGTMNVPETGLALLHKGEIVIDALTSRFLRGLMNQRGPQLAAAGITNSSRSLNLGGMTINAGPGQSVMDVGAEVERRLVNILEMLGK